MYLWLIHTDVWQGPAQQCGVIILQLTLKKKKKLDSFNRKKNFKDDCAGKSSVNTLPNGNIWCASFHLKASYRSFTGTTERAQYGHNMGSPVAWNSLPPDRYRAKGKVVGCR